MSSVKSASKLLIKNNLSIATAESLTGGMIADSLVNTPGMSKCFSYGFVTYSDTAKENILRVNHSTLENYGAVSYECAKEMSKNVRNITGSRIGLASTGFAGPATGEENYPVGTVFISVAMDNHIITRRFVFSGNRQTIRKKAKNAAFTLLLKTIKRFLP